ncbi:class I SAM-dependent DNA methyltransferase [Sulfurisoma sediminicola]|uniref:site-specific DNA-methyltransferase (adenine-specific) n=1 Tax=Sulfurisoma sediminicola TaxID=1381557 RepID=A0A497XIG0_9PROT|nr:DNA methyltransferase [Sulfurisoma sediminicola]RLJ67661.1 type II restriction/modification system DNA methylase subunit YeeA [Sulfurisoma sediminicola]
MTPEKFIALWRDNPLTERAGAQGHFDDLCDLLGVDKPRDPDDYCFERGAGKAGGGDGWADVWKRGHFGWENKRPGRDLRAALKQLTDYALELENPPLLVVCDRERIEIHTAFTGYPDEPRTVRIDEIGTPENLQLLRWVFTEPEKLRPVKSLAAITEEAAGKFGALAETLRRRGLDAQPVAHFLIQCLFCMFAEDEGLLPRGLFTGLLTKAASDPARAANRLTALFAAMRDGGDYGDETIAWFNGGLFATVAVPELARDDVAALQHAADMDWRNIDPSIFGTLFERGLNPAKRSQLGAHYTDPATIMRLVEPVVVRPLAAEWQAAKDRIAALMAKSKKQGDKAYKDAAALFQHHLERLRNFRVLDPACGSGNFLYLALKALKDLERRANVEAEALGLQRQVGIEVSPANVLGLELDPYAAELARVTVWIGEIQWMLRNGYPYATRPILRPLDTIENRDALINLGGSGTATEAEWPICDVVVGNPPFLGGSLMRGELGSDYVQVLRRVYDSRVPAGANLVTYWFEKSRAQIAAKKLEAAGLVSTNAIRQTTNRKVLEGIVADGEIFEAWSDEPWVNEGAAVRVSLICFGPSSDANRPIHLDGDEVNEIHADLTAGAGLDLTTAASLTENANVAFNGYKRNGPFDIPGSLARQWLSQPNPNGKGNADVLHPMMNGNDLTKRSRDVWLIDFGVRSTFEDASLYEAPFEYALRDIRSARQKAPTEKLRDVWWIHEGVRIGFREALKNLHRFAAISEKSKHFYWVWVDSRIAPDNRLVVVARDDDVTFGIIQSRIHELWALRKGATLEDRPCYTPTTTFETFPFPAGLTPRDTAPVPGQPTPPCMAAQIPAANIAAAARRLNELREHWLNPPEWTERIAEVVPGYPDRIVAKPGFEAELKKRTLTNLYNARPAWLANAHQALDAAVAAAYGWTDYAPDMPDEEILRRLLALNLERKAAEGA